MAQPEVQVDRDPVTRRLLVAGGSRANVRMTAALQRRTGGAPELRRAGQRRRDVTGATEIDFVGALQTLLGNMDLFAYAIEDLMDQVDFDPERVVPRSVDEV